MGKCGGCGRESIFISTVIGYCKFCILKNPALVEGFEEKRRRWRNEFSLPEVPPENGVRCRFCINECRISEGGIGYCGVRRNEGGRIVGGTVKARLRWYYDPIPTNCVSAWVCSATKMDRGKVNLAVFYEGCSFDCAFCQNWHFREEWKYTEEMDVEGLLSAVHRRVSCICFFGGDPSPSIVHSILVGRRAVESGVKVCWETNGAFNPSFANAIAELLLEGGGCIKFDLKAFSEPIQKALCGTSNRNTLENIRLIYERTHTRKEPPPIVISTLLVPGYVDEDEVYKIASFIRDIDPDIPYSLLAFYPAFILMDLPPTPREQAERCYKSALDAGLKRIHIGNIHLLW